MSLTIRDVAKKAGVGVATVSRVMNNSGQVSPQMRELVRAAITEMGYVPNPTARRLSLGRTFTIGVIVPFFTRYSFVERLRAIENLLANAGYDVVIFNVETVERRDKYFSEVPRADRVDGVIIISLVPPETQARALKNSGVPVVLVDIYNPLLPSVSEDSVAGGRNATQHLLELGHREIAYIGDIFENPFDFTSSRNRYQGYAEALTAAGIPLNPDLVRLGEHGRAQAREMALSLLRAHARPSAIFASSDTQAMGILEAARDLGLRVPEDLSVIGYDDIEVAEYLGISTMRQSLFESGTLGAELLLHLLSGPDASQVPMFTPIPSALIARSTTGPLL